MTLVLAIMLFLGQRVGGWGADRMKCLSTQPADRGALEPVETRAFFFSQRKSDEIHMILLLQKLKSDVESESS